MKEHKEAVTNIMENVKNEMLWRLESEYQRGYEDGKEAELAELKTIKIKMPNDDGVGMIEKIKDLIRESDKNHAYTLSYPAYVFISRLKKIVGWQLEDYEKPQKGFEKCSECKYKDADLCKTEPLHEEDEDGNCVDFVPEAMPRKKWSIVKYGWLKVPKCRECKYFDSALMPCNKCKDNSEFEPKEERKTDEIKVGDEVYDKYNPYPRVVTSINKQDMADLIDARGNAHSDSVFCLNKTGRHYPQITEVLEQMQKESEYHADPYHADFAWDVKAVVDNFRKESE